MDAHAVRAASWCRFVADIPDTTLRGREYSRRTIVEQIVRTIEPNGSTALKGNKHEFASRRHRP